MLSQETRIKLQSLIHHLEVTSINVADKRAPYGKIYSDVTIHIKSDVETANQILSSIDGLTLGTAEAFDCEHKDTNSISIGHLIHGNIEGCGVTVFATKEIKKAPALDQGTQVTNQPDYIADWTAEQIIAREA